MTATYSGADGLSAVRTYLEDDRIEVGRINVALVEELARVSWRDVVAVVFVGGPWRVGSAVVACIVLLMGLGFCGGAAAADAVAVPILLGIGGALLLTGGAGLWLSRPERQLRFRVEGVRSYVEGVVGGSAKKRAAFRRDLLRRIETAKLRGAARPAAGE